MKKDTIITALGILGGYIIYEIFSASISKDNLYADIRADETIKLLTEIRDILADGKTDSKSQEA